VCFLRKCDDYFPVSIVIPTYRREKILLATISALCRAKARPEELIVVDQTSDHKPETINQLQDWEVKGIIKRLILAEPSITLAMNTGLMAAQRNLVLFLDDDVSPHEGLLLGHYSAHNKDPSLWASVGQVIQPWQKRETIQVPQKTLGIRKDFDFPFHSTVDADVENVMAGNLCVNRERALAIGGFDEQFTGTAYRFETDFARRIVYAGGKIRFIGSAGIDHLRAETGGTRSGGSHLTSASPEHGIGDHYYAMRHGRRLEALFYSLRRLFREVCTKFHLTHPWFIPVKLVGEIRAIMMARRMVKIGPKLLSSGERD
jgi:GT2 family glycosyltransferase